MLIIKDGRRYFLFTVCTPPNISFLCVSSPLLSDSCLRARLSVSSNLPLCSRRHSRSQQPKSERAIHLRNRVRTSCSQLFHLSKSSQLFLQLKSLVAKSSYIGDIVRDGLASSSSMSLRIVISFGNSTPSSSSGSIYH